jgi:hypothetical protein
MGLLSVVSSHDRLRIPSLSKRDGKRRKKRERETHLVGHQQQVLTLLNHTRLNLTDNDATHVRVLLRDRHHQRGVVLAVLNGEVVEELEEGRTLNPGSDGTDGLLDVGTGETGNGDEGHVGLHVVAGTLKEGGELANNLVVSEQTASSIVSFSDGEVE